MFPPNTRTLMTHDQQIRQQLSKALDWGEAHADFQTAVADFPEDLRGEVPPGFSHSAWDLLEHLRIALWDIVEFSKDARRKKKPGTSASNPLAIYWRRCAG